MQCYFTKNKIEFIDYKDTEMLKLFINSFGRMKTRRYTGVCGKHQRQVADAIKHARFMALVPYIVK
jgi:small subunit ribosomal protein S18